MFSALVTFFLIRPLSHDGMRDEDAAFRAYLARAGYDVSLIGVESSVSSESFEEDEKRPSDVDVVKEVQV